VTDDSAPGAPGSEPGEPREHAGGQPKQAEDSKRGEDEPDSEQEREPGDVPEASVPEVETPRAEVPTPEVPELDNLASNPETLQAHSRNVDPAFKTFFWKLVLVYKFGILGLSLGFLMVVFETRPTLGGQLALGGGALILYGVYLTRKGKRQLDAGEYDMGDRESGTNGNSESGPTSTDAKPADGEESRNEQVEER